MNTHAFRFVLILMCALGLTTSAQSQTTHPQTLGIGDVAPDFRLQGVDGSWHSLADFADADVLAIVFTTNHCPTAQAYEDRLIEMADRFANDSFALVAISPNDPTAVRLDELGYSDLSDSLEEMKIRAADKQFPFPYLYDGQYQAAAQAYGPVATPHAFVFDADRKLRYVGRIDDDESGVRVTSPDLDRAVESVLAGKSVSVAETKVFGCTVKWADKRTSAADALEQWSMEEVSVEAVQLDAIQAVVANSGENLRLINLWATWCGPCIAEFPELVKIHRMYRGRDFELVTINMDVPARAERVSKFLIRQHASMTNYRFDSDDKYALIDAVDSDWPGALPYTVLVAPGGEVVYRQMGEIDPLSLRKAVVDYLGRTYFN